MILDEILFDQLSKLRNKLFDAQTNNVDLIKHSLYEDGQEILDNIENLITKVSSAMQRINDEETN